MFWELSNLLLYFIKNFIKEGCWEILLYYCISGFLNHEVWDSWRSEKSKDSRINCRWVSNPKESNNFWNFPIFPISRTISKMLEFVMLIKKMSSKYLVKLVKSKEFSSASKMLWPHCAAYNMRVLKMPKISVRRGEGHRICLTPSHQAIFPLLYTVLHVSYILDFLLLVPFLC